MLTMLVILSLFNAGALLALLGIVRESFRFHGLIAKNLHQITEALRTTDDRTREWPS